MIQTSSHEATWHEFHTYLQGLIVKGGSQSIVASGRHFRLITIFLPITFIYLESKIIATALLIVYLIL